jgi:hypothetical protein
MHGVHMTQPLAHSALPALISDTNCVNSAYYVYISAVDMCFDAMAKQAGGMPSDR